MGAVLSGCTGGRRRGTIPKLWVREQIRGVEALAARRYLIRPQNGPPDYARETWALPSQPSQHRMLKLSFRLPGPA